MFEALRHHAWNFLQEFIGEPEMYWQDFSLIHILRSAAIHFLSSACAGFVGFWLMQTILSQRRSAWPARYIFNTSLLFGLAISATMHIAIDGFTNLA